MADPYEAQKTRFSNFQSNYHKLLNTLKKKEFNNEQLIQLVKINETLDILEAHVLDFNENNCSLKNEELEHIKKNNDTLEFLKPIAILHRFLLDIKE